MKKPKQKLSIEDWPCLYVSTRPWLKLDAWMNHQNGLFLSLDRPIFWVDLAYKPCIRIPRPSKYPHESVNVLKLWGSTNFQGFLEGPCRQLAPKRPEK